MATETLSVKITADISNFSSNVSNMQNQVQNTAKSFEGLNRVGEGFKNVGAKMTATGVALVGSLGLLVSKGAEYQSSIESTQFLYNNLDKAVQQTIASNSKNANSIGLTTQQYKANATTIATYYKNMGLTAKETASLSDKTMNLVADLGAVADVPFDEAMGDFKSGLMGKVIAPCYRNVA